jgi:leucyl-tRNA synthetase
VRIFSLFAAPVENDLRWQEAGIDGALRFLRRVYSTVYRWRATFADVTRDEPNSDELSDAARALRRKTHQTISRVADDLEEMHFNTAIAALMELLNELVGASLSPEAAPTADKFAAREALESLVLMLAPFAPHAAEEMWEGLGHAGGILRSGARFPVADAELAKKETLEIPVQINGKLRGRISASPDTSEAELRTAALADEKVRGFMEGRELVKVIVVPRRLVNIVVK